MSSLPWCSCVCLPPHTHTHAVSPWQEGAQVAIGVVTEGPWIVVIRRQGSQAQLSVLSK